MNLDHWIDEGFVTKYCDVSGCVFDHNADRMFDGLADQFGILGAIDGDHALREGESYWVFGMKFYISITDERRIGKLRSDINADRLRSGIKAANTTHDVPYEDEVLRRDSTNTVQLPVASTESWLEALPAVSFVDSESTRWLDGIVDWMKKTKNPEGDKVIDSVLEAVPLLKGRSYRVAGVEIKLEIV